MQAAVVVPPTAVLKVAAALVVEVQLVDPLVQTAQKILVVEVEALVKMALLSSAVTAVLEL
jgi:hypothetical protein